MENRFINPVRGQGVSEGNQKNETSNGVKITNAVYKLLDFFPEGDPLKYRAKEKALVILENLTLIFDGNGWVSLKIYFSPEREKIVVQLLDDIEILENYLKIGKYQGWIDNINFLIIAKEYRLIEASLRKQFPISLDPQGLPKVDIQFTNKSKIQNTNNQRNSGKNNESETKNEEPRRPTSAYIADVGRLEKDDQEYSDRQRKILQILSQREKAQVSDLIKELPNITKRTIRRDLDDLLKRGKIIRAGEWNQVFYKILKDTDKDQENKVSFDRTGVLS